MIGHEKDYPQASMWETEGGWKAIVLSHHIHGLWVWHLNPGTQKLHNKQGHGPQPKYNLKKPWVDRSKPDLKVVAEGYPHLMNLLQDYIDDVKKGKTLGFAIVSIEEDGEVFANWGFRKGTSLCELCGATDVLKADMLDDIRGVGQ